MPTMWIVADCSNTTKEDSAFIISQKTRKFENLAYWRKLDLTELFHRTHKKILCITMHVLYKWQRGNPYRPIIQKGSYRPKVR